MTELKRGTKLRCNRDGSIQTVTHSKDYGLFWYTEEGCYTTYDNIGPGKAWEIVEQKTAEAEK